jgi:hypothetical protein
MSSVVAMSIKLPADTFLYPTTQYLTCFLLSPEEAQLPCSVVEISETEPTLALRLLLENLNGRITPDAPVIVEIVGLVNIDYVRERNDVNMFTVSFLSQEGFVVT